MSFSARHKGFLSRVARGAVLGCEAVAITAILGLFLVVAVNIFMRALFDASGSEINLMIPGAVELASYALLIAVFAALPAGLENGLIRVDVLTGLMPDALQSFLNRFWFVVLFLFALSLAWLFADQVMVTREQGEVTQDWGIPLWIIYLVITLECIAFAIVSLAEVIDPVISAAELG
ncbi:TRAP transporter small permease [uncultured Roseibium sp.]|uniref:TRAP transporter small permease n=1 Tax=uncultured Roseibium sp. TaxID=1936171 RepID=UPI00321661D5